MLTPLQQFLSQVRPDKTSATSYERASHFVPSFAVKIGAMQLN